MDSLFQGLILGFREGLEAFLIIIIILQYLNKTKTTLLKKHVFRGAASGVAASLIIGGILFAISDTINKTGEMAKLWESIASFIALILVSTFIVWMIKNGRSMVSSIQDKVSVNFSKTGLFLLSAAMVAREGAELAIFSFAGKYSIWSLLIGVLIALVISILIYFSLLKVNIKTIFNVTLVYLILQAGFLLGYSIHEGLSAFNDLDIISGDSILFIKAYNLSDTIFYHKEGLIGLPLYVLTGWYSKPEWIQFILQYTYTASMFLLWFFSRRKEK